MFYIILKHSKLIPVQDSIGNQYIIINESFLHARSAYKTFNKGYSNPDTAILQHAAK